MFRLAPNTLPEADTERLERLWLAFERNILWLQQAREDALHPAGCTMTTCHHGSVAGVRSKLDEIYQWEDFARVNYDREPEEIDWNA